MIDRRGAYCPELLILEPYGSDNYSDPTNWRLHTVQCKRLTVIKASGFGARLSDNPFHVNTATWWSGDLSPFAEYIGESLESIARRFASSGPLDRAFLYHDLFNYHGSANFDEYPRELNKRQASNFCRAMDRQVKATGKWADGYGVNFA